MDTFCSIILNDSENDSEPERGMITKVHGRGPGKKWPSRRRQGTQVVPVDRVTAGSPGATAAPPAGCWVLGKQECWLSHVFQSDVDFKAKSSLYPRALTLEDSLLLR